MKTREILLFLLKHIYEYKQPIRIIIYQKPLVVNSRAVFLYLNCYEEIKRYSNAYKIQAVLFIPKFLSSKEFSK